MEDILQKAASMKNADAKKSIPDFLSLTARIRKYNPVSAINATAVL